MDRHTVFGAITKLKIAKSLTKILAVVITDSMALAVWIRDKTRLLK